MLEKVMCEIKIINSIFMENYLSTQLDPNIVHGPKEITFHNYNIHYYLVNIIHLKI